MKLKQVECEFCKSGVEHISSTCWNYAGHVKKDKPPKLEKLDLRGQLMGSEQYFVEIIDKINQLVDAIKEINND